MKSLLAVCLLVVLCGCESSTNYGMCVGAFENNDRDPKLVYKISTINVAVAVVGFELIVPPVVVIANETFCPVGEKTPVMLTQ